MKTIKQIVIAGFILGFTVSALAAGLSSKEPAGCLGPYQAYIFTYVFDPDNWAQYVAQAKNAGQSGPWITKHGSAGPVFCKFVGLGLPLGNYAHNWKGVGVSPGFFDSTWTFFKLHDNCEIQP